MSHIFKPGGQLLDLLGSFFRVCVCESLFTRDSRVSPVAKQGSQFGLGDCPGAGSDILVATFSLGQDQFRFLVGLDFGSPGGVHFFDTRLNVDGEAGSAGFV